MSFWIGLNFRPSNHHANPFRSCIDSECGWLAVRWCANMAHFDLFFGWKWFHEGPEWSVEVQWTFFESWRLTLDELHGWTVWFRDRDGGHSWRCGGSWGWCGRGELAIMCCCDHNLTSGRCLLMWWRCHTAEWLLVLIGELWLLRCGLKLYNVGFRIEWFQPIKWFETCGGWLRHCGCWRGGLYLCSWWEDTWKIVGTIAWISERDKGSQGRWDAGRHGPQPGARHAAPVSRSSAHGWDIRVLGTSGWQ